MQMLRMQQLPTASSNKTPPAETTANIIIYFSSARIVLSFPASLQAVTGEDRRLL